MSDDNSPSWANGWVKIIGAVSAAIVAILLAWGQLDNGKETVRETRVEAAVPEAIAVDSTGDAKPDKIVELGPEAREVTADLVEDGGPPDLENADGELRGDDGPKEPVAVPRPPLAADSISGCNTRFLTTNWSYRSVAQSQVIWFTLHYTAGYDKPGSRADVDGLTAYGNNPASRVSWHFNLDKDGNCDYNVPLRYKAWTFGNANDRSINTEVHGRGEAPYLRPAGYRKLARIFIQVRNAYPQIQLRVGSVNSCSSGSAGVTTHWQGGACSGGHTDIRPHEIAQVVATLRRYVSALECGKRCKAKRSQRRVVDGRARKHKKTHARYRERRCRRGMHKTRPREFRRAECRRLKLKGKRQHAGVRRAKRKLAAL